MALRVCITGATGFVGGALARALANQGAEVHALARPSADRRPLQDVPMVWHEGDVTVADSLADAVRDCGWVIHAAGRLGQAGVSEEAYHRVNVDGTRNVLTAAQAAPSRPRVLHISTPGVLGPTGRNPAPEDAPFAASNAYERSKATAERIALTYAERGMTVVVARPGFIYGPGDRHVLRLFKAIESGRFFYIGGGMHLCQPTFIADVVAGLLACLRQGQTGEVYHLVGPRPLSFRQLGQTIAAALEVAPPRWNLPRWLVAPAAAQLEALSRMTRRQPPLSRTGVDFFSEDRVFCYEKARRELGYVPTHELPAGARITVAWYRQHGWL